MIKEEFTKHMHIILFIERKKKYNLKKYETKSSNIISIETCEFLKQH